MRSHRIKAQAGLAAALIVMVLCMAAVIAGTIYRGDLRAALPGSVAPNFVLRDENDNDIALADLRGNVVVVYFTPRSDGDSSSAVSQLPSQSASVDALDHSASAPRSSPSSEVAPDTTADLSQLSALCQQLGGTSKVKVFSLSGQPTTSAAPSTKPAIGSDFASLSIGNSSVQSLVDPTGDVARRYRVDPAGTSPTFFVIDGSGVIRYRGGLQKKSDLIDQILPPTSDRTSAVSPSTQPSSLKQAVQMLLSSEAVNAPSSNDHL